MFALVPVDQGGLTVPGVDAVLEPGSTADAGRGYELFLGYRVVAPGRSTVKGVRISYSDLGNAKPSNVMFRDTMTVARSRSPPMRARACWHLSGLDPGDHAGEHRHAGVHPCTTSAARHHARQHGTAAPQGHPCR